MLSGTLRFESMRGEPVSDPWDDRQPGREPEAGPGDDGPAAEPAAPDPAEATAPPGRSSSEDANLVAVDRAGLDAATAEWLREVAAQVDPRLDRVASDWRQREEAEAARACVFGLLLGHLAGRYPHVRQAIHQVVEAHPSYSTLATGERLRVLEGLVADSQRMAAWVGPLVGVNDPQTLRSLLD